MEEKKSTIGYDVYYSCDSSHPGTDESTPAINDGYYVFDYSTLIRLSNVQFVDLLCQVTLAKHFDAISSIDTSSLEKEGDYFVEHRNIDVSTRVPGSSIEITEEEKEQLLLVAQQLVVDHHTVVTINCSDFAHGVKLQRILMYLVSFNMLDYVAPLGKINPATFKSAQYVSSYYFGTPSKVLLRPGRVTVKQTDDIICSMTVGYIDGTKADIDSFSGFPHADELRKVLEERMDIFIMALDDDVSSQLVANLFDLNLSAADLRALSIVLNHTDVSKLKKFIEKLNFSMNDILRGELCDEYFRYLNAMKRAGNVDQAPNPIFRDDDSGKLDLEKTLAQERAPEQKLKAMVDKYFEKFNVSEIEKIKRKIKSAFGKNGADDEDKITQDLVGAIIEYAKAVNPSLYDWVYKPQACRICENHNCRNIMNAISDLFDKIIGEADRLETKAAIIGRLSDCRTALIEHYSSLHAGDIKLVKKELPGISDEDSEVVCDYMHIKFFVNEQNGLCYHDFDKIALMITVLSIMARFEKLNSATLNVTIRRLEKIIPYNCYSMRGLVDGASFGTRYYK